MAVATETTISQTSDIDKLKLFQVLLNFALDGFSHPTTIYSEKASIEKLPEPRGEILINLSERLHVAYFLVDGFPRNEVLGSIKLCHKIIQLVN